MNSVHEQCLNSDPKQCTVTKLGYVHSASHPKTRSCVQCQGRERCCAHSKQVVTPYFHRPGRDLKSMPRSASSLPTETPLSRPKTLVATSNHNKAARIMSRHQIDVATPLRPLMVVTSKRGRNTVSLAQPQARSQHQPRSRPFWRLTYVATSISCRNIVSAHNGLSRSRRQKSRPRLPFWPVKIA